MIIRNKTTFKDKKHFYFLKVIFYSSISLSTCYYSSKYSSKQIPLLIISFAAVLPTYL